MSTSDRVFSGDRSDPLLRHRFSVSVEGRPPIGVAEIHGLSVAVTEAPGEDEPAPTSENEDRKWWDLRGLIDSVTRGASPMEPRSTSSPTLELRRGVTPDVPLFEWLHDWVRRTTAARDVQITLLDERRDPAVGWVCQSARPVEWTGPTLTAEAAAVAVETLELAHEGIVLVEDP